MKFTILFFLSLLLVSCGKDNTGVPDVYVNYHVTVQEFNIKNQSGVLLVDGHGVAGLIIYKRADNSYVAFDRCSTVNPEKRCAVVPDDPNSTATDPCSDAKFSLYDGNPVKAPAKKALRQYYVSISNNSLISVTN